MIYRFYYYICIQQNNLNTIFYTPLYTPLMSVIFQLKDKSRTTSSILIVICFKGQYYKKSTGETTPPKYWNQNTKRCRVMKDYPEGDDINTILDKWDAAANRTIAHFKEYKTLPEPAEFWARFDTEYYKDESKPDNYFIEFLAQYIDGIRETRAESTVKKYTTTLNKLREYEAGTNQRIKFSDINIEFYNSFRRWIYKKNYSSNYFGAFIRIIKKISREAYYLGLSDNIRGIEHRDFVTVNEDADKIYLTNEEIEAIFNVDITPAAILSEFEDTELSPGNIHSKIMSMKLVRERFLIGAYSGLRVSDFSRLDSLNFGAKTIKTTTVKTGKPVVIPIHDNIRKLFAEGFDPSVKISDQKMNKHLKELARLAGIKAEIIITENIAGKNVPKKYKKYELVCTHTARRSFATNALKAGVPLSSISKILGHTKISTTEKYLRMSAEETAEALLDHAFFRAK